ncbi:hypothetical protein RF11_10688 [Thelohanellus kitauei]|uniref:Uncharacterized protein n=1 Tax=Thelohanellus kitauei TaxID=669202 RepID=A0A0C2IVD0_THEKT|nr:hypothetical protein RF11_10688 [Thelohanellus kitauei]
MYLSVYQGADPFTQMRLTLHNKPTLKLLVLFDQYLMTNVFIYFSNYGLENHIPSYQYEESTFLIKNLKFIPFDMFEESKKSLSVTLYDRIRDIPNECDSIID